MTAEVAIMNQHALVFGADSATTVTMWVKQQSQVRYFKGANKLFQLSNTHPVGLMINDSASLQDVPWELVVKEFRKHLGNESCTRLADYSARFFDFIKGHQGFFPEKGRDKYFSDLIDFAIAKELENAEKTAPFVATAIQAKDDERIEAALVQWGTDALAAYKDQKPEPPISHEDVEAAVASHRANAVKIAAGESKPTPWIELFAELAIRKVMCEYTRFLPSTGVVIGGFGEEEYFPSIEVFTCFGFLDRHFITRRQDDSCKQINTDLHSAIETFATDSMINSFRMGIGLDVYSWVRQSTRLSLQDFAEKIRVQLSPERQIENLSDLIKEAEDACQSSWFKRTLNEHYQPLNKVVGSLPINDMAALAKSLIELQSLKERVTDSTESVSGPIDVAAITKHDGFVWIERKHYFRAELNPRFIARQRRLSNLEV